MQTGGQHGTGSGGSRKGHAHTWACRLEQESSLLVLEPASAMGCWQAAGKRIQHRPPSACSRRCFLHMVEPQARSGRHLGLQPAWPAGRTQMIVGPRGPDSSQLFPPVCRWHLNHGLCSAARQLWVVNACGAQIVDQYTTNA